MRYALFAVAGLGLLASWLVVAHGTTHTGFDVIYVWVDKTAGPRAVIHGMIANRGVNGDPITQCGVAAEIQVVGEHQHHGLHRVSAPVDCNRGEPAY